ncbi:hypothetical protein M1O16_00960 [Dehalococcoidia bacterium]|nr:hypothetical protein [Dehalococcoidia bacterium]MCL0089473.1 hypothetical protein [Dehalococcoidia bacterium]MCL0098425.1 hypothetical protein [Dehalococcoidia bacterium]
MELWQVWPIRLLIERRSAELVLDPVSFPQCVSKEVRVWRWKKMKTVKFIVHRKEDDTYDVIELS